MAKNSPPLLDCIILGDHPASYLASILLGEDKSLKILHAALPGQQEPERLVLINPAFFDLHPLLGRLRGKLDLTSIFGMHFLCDTGPARGEYSSKVAVAQVASYRQVRAEMMVLARQESVDLIAGRELAIHRVDEHGIDLTLGKSSYRARALLVGGELRPEHRKTLGINDGGAPPALHRYTFARLKGAPEQTARPVLPVCLQLGEAAHWAWLFPHGAAVQVGVSQPIETVAAHPPETLLRQWVVVLRQHGVIPEGREFPLDSVGYVDIPLAAALEIEGVANRTLLFGPAGGFYSMLTEDIYPNCWSAPFAVAAMQSSLKDRHLQDALNVYRSNWRTTLGDYLRGPSVNLKYLLPLVYRNPVMTARISESFLMGKGVVR